MRIPCLLVTAALGWLSVAASVAARPADADPVASPIVKDSRLRVDLFAREPQIVTPVALDVDATGAVWVIESHTHFPEEDYPGPESDRLLVFRDTDGDGRADERRIFADGFRHAMALELIDPRSAFLATRREVFRLEDTDGDGAVDVERSLARLVTKGNYPHNGLAGFARDEFGRLFIGLGENLGVPYELVGTDGRTHRGGGEGGNVFRLRADGSGLEHWATGFWNPFNFCHDAYGNLFIVDNDPDSRPPCRLIHVIRNGDYGYRFELGRSGLHPFTSWNGQLPGTLPMAAGTAEAPSGLVAYEHDALPAQYRGKLFSTSWGDHRIEVFDLEARGASYSGSATALVQGDENFRPVDIEIAPDGSLYFSDWVDRSYNVHGKGRVWRLSVRQKPAGDVEDTASGSAVSGEEPGAEADGAVAAALTELESDDQLEADSVRRWLGHARACVRRDAVERLLQRSDEPAFETLRAVATSAGDERARYHATVALARAGKLTGDLVRRALAVDASADLGAACLRLYFEQPGEEPWPLADGVLDRLPPRAQLEAFLHATTLEVVWATLCDIIDADAGADPFLVFAATDALARLGTRETVSAFERSDRPARRLAAVLAARRRGEKERLPVFLRDADPEVRRTAIQWVGEARLEALREEVVSALAMTPPRRKVFDAALATLALLDGENPKARDRQQREVFLLSLAADAGRDDALRAMALRLVPPGSPHLETQHLLELARADAPALRTEAVRHLAHGKEPATQEFLAQLATDEQKPVALRLEAILGLDPQAETSAAALLGLCESEVETIREEAIASVAGTELRTRLEDAARRWLDARREQLVGRYRETPENAWKQELLSRPGDARRGERVFFRPRGASCYRCHTVAGRGGEAGPDLSSAREMDADRILDSILHPGRDIAPRYATWRLITTQGVKTGALLGELPDTSVLLATPEGTTETIPRESILQKEPLDTSIMPEDVADTLTLRELRDLIAFLRH